MNEPIIRISEEAQADNAAMAQTFHEIDAAVKGGDVPWLAFDVPKGVAPWKADGVTRWVQRAILVELRALDGLALEVGREGEIPGLGRVGIFAIAATLFPQAPHGDVPPVTTTATEIRRAGEVLVRFQAGRLICPEATFKRHLREFCARRGLKVISAARGVGKDADVGIVEIETALGPILWRASIPGHGGDKHNLRVQLVEVARLCANIHRDCTAGATQLAPTHHPAFAAIAANDIRAVRALL